MPDPCRLQPVRGGGGRGGEVGDSDLDEGGARGRDGDVVLVRGFEARLHEGVEARGGEGGPWVFEGCWRGADVV